MLLSKQYKIFFTLLLILLLPNLAFIFTGQDSAVVTILKKIVFFIFTFSLILLPLSFLRPKIYFWILLPLIPLGIIDLFIIKISGTQSTAMHYYAVLATNYNESLEFIGSNLYVLIAGIFIMILYISLVINLNSDFNLSKRIKKIILVSSSFIILSLFIRDLYIANLSNTNFIIQKAVYHFFVKFDKTYPWGAISKVESAFNGFKKTKNFEVLNSNFSYNSTIINDSNQTIVLVIGETARRANFQLYGYQRATNPLLVKLSNLIPFSNCTTNANFTLTSVTQMLSSTKPDTYDQAFNETGIIEAFKEAGFHTYWITNQMYGIGTFYYLYSKDADSYIDISKTLDIQNYDGIILPYINRIINDHHKKRFIVIHSIGSHFRYNLRYPKSFSKFKPELTNDLAIHEINKKFKDRFINSYDNSILYTDFFLSSLIDILKQNNEPALMLYLSDHGENLFDDDRNLILHGSIKPSEFEINIPMIMWYSENYEKQKVNRLKSVKDKKVSAAFVFHTLSSLGGFKTKFHDNAFDLLSDHTVFGKRLFLKPDNTVINIDTITKD